VGTVSELVPDGALVRCAGDEETVMAVSSKLALHVGDRVVYARDFPYVISKLAKRDQSAFLLEHVPPQTFDDIGGLDDVQTKRHVSSQYVVTVLVITRGSAVRVPSSEDVSTHYGR
jgi:ATP-dependent 26S proteasome regulatory subunit